MPNALSVSEKLETAARLVLRARVFYDIWRLYVGEETRPAIIDAMNCYSEFFRFDPHAHFVAFIVHMAGLLERRSDTVNLQRLAKELENSGVMTAQDAMAIDGLLRQAMPLARKVALLRNSLFAHRSASLSYSDAFRKAAVTPNELCDLTEITLKIVNQMLKSQGLKAHAFNSLPAKNALDLLKALAPS